MWISYLPDGTRWESGTFLDIQISQGRHATVVTLPPSKMLEFRLSIYGVEFVDGQRMIDVCGKEPAGWFERMCAEANCEWFVPLAKRMAAGEAVPLKEIQSAYRHHNGGKEMPCGDWGVLFSLKS
jgi:hypothetical protein